MATHDLSESASVAGIRGLLTRHIHDEVEAGTLGVVNDLTDMKLHRMFFL